MCQACSDPAQVRFREALLRLRNAEVTEDYWYLFMTRTAGAAQRNGEDLTRFVEAIRLFPTVERVAEYNLACLHRLNHPIAHIKAVHNCADDKKEMRMSLVGSIPQSFSVKVHALCCPVTCGLKED